MLVVLCAFVFIALLSAMAVDSEYQLIFDAVEFTLHHTQLVEDQIVEALETSGATRYVNALRMLTMQSAIIAIGAFQSFEGLLQLKKGWKDTFTELDGCLRVKGYADLADRFVDYRDAINVLKHGEGRSYDKLVARRDNMPFTVKDKGQRFFDEGDVSEGIQLVKANHEFVRQCSNIIQEVVQALGSALPNHLSNQ